MVDDEKVYRVKVKPFEQIRMCNCARCGRELLGLADRDQAFRLKMQVATYVLDRPYCFQCGQAEGAKSETCAHCGDRPFLREMRVEYRKVMVCGVRIDRVKLYCLWCSVSVGPRSRPEPIGARHDAHARTRPPGTNNLLNYNTDAKYDAA